MKVRKRKDYIFLHVVLLLYSLTTVLSKTASSKSGIGFLICYAGVLTCLGVYAILWQIVLKKFPLSIAFANKAIVVIWGMVWGLLLFDEAITICKAIGAIVIIIGIVCVVSDDGEK